METKLKRGLNLLDVFCIATGAMISSGLFILPGLAHAKAGPAVVFSYAIAGFLAMMGMLSQAELVSAMPKAGGDYFYITRSMGPAMGTIEGLLTWLSISLKGSFALVGMAAFTILAVDINPKLIALFFCLFFLLVNFIGIKEAGRAQVGIVLALIAILIFYIYRGIPNVQVQNFKPFAPNGIVPIFSTAGFVFVSYGGLLKVASVAEEVKNPARTVPLGMILSLVVASILYALTVFVTSGVLPNVELNNSMTPISDGAAKFLGKGGVIALGIAAMLAFISTANAGIMSASRYPLALSRDGLLPKFLGNISKHFKTPGIAILFTGIIMIVSLFLNIGLLVEVASTVLIITFMFSCLCVIIMRESRVQNYQPKFRCPFYPWVQIVGIFGSWMLLINMGKGAHIIATALFSVGIFVYWFYGRVRANKDFALLHLVERITAKEFVDGSLETELKEIIRERDDIIKDRFDGIVEDSVVLDLDEEVDADAFFKLVAEELSFKVGVDTANIYNALVKREKESSTVITPGLAIPHIIIEGYNQFIILLARSKKGITFKEDPKPVHTVFVLAGSRDERNFHLRALSAIAQIAQNPNFEKTWMKARGGEALRDLVLLGKRKRHN